MSNVSVALQILSKAEGELRSVIERALAEGSYSDVATIARIADGLAQLSAAEPVDEGQSAPRAERSRPAVQPAPSPAQPPVSRGGRTARTFPRFERESDKLVKIAWSKKDRAEYEHKAPRRIVDLLLESIRSRKGEGAKFDAPDVLPLKDSRTRREVPSYQSYLALAWLRHEGVITKYGRDGYALKPTAATPDHLSELWEALPSRG